MCTSLYRLRSKCQCSHNSQQGNLKPDWSLNFGSSVQLESQPDLLLPNAMIIRKTNKSFCKRAACTSKDDIQGWKKTSLKHVRTKHRRLNLLSDWRITICMEQSISQSPRFLYPIKEEDFVQWGFYLLGCQMDPDWRPWQLCDWHLWPSNHE